MMIIGIGDQRREDIRSRASVLTQVHLKTQTLMMNDIIAIKTGQLHLLMMRRERDYQRRRDIKESRVNILSQASPRRNQTVIGIIIKATAANTDILIVLLHQGKSILNQKIIEKAANTDILIVLFHLRVQTLKHIIGIDIIVITTAIVSIHRTLVPVFQVRRLTFVV